MGRNPRPAFKQKHPLAHERDPNYITGRPTSYRPEYCDQLIEWMRKGHSFSSFAGKVGVNTDTLYHWSNLFPAFSDAAARARAVRLIPWEEKLITAKASGEVNATIFALKNINPQEYRDTTHQHIQHDVNINMLSDEQLMQLASRGARSLPPAITSTPGGPVVNVIDAQPIAQPVAAKKRGARRGPRKRLPKQLP